MFLDLVLPLLLCVLDNVGLQLPVVLFKIFQGICNLTRGYKRIGLLLWSYT